MTPFSPQTQNLSFGHLWIDERKAALPKTGIDILRDVEKKGVWWQHEKYSPGKHKFPSNTYCVQRVSDYCQKKIQNKNKLVIVKSTEEIIPNLPCFYMGSLLYFRVFPNPPSVCRNVLCWRAELKRDKGRRS